MPEVRHQEGGDYEGKSTAQELLKQIGDAVASSKGTEALVLIPKLREKLRINENLLEELRDVVKCLQEEKEDIVDEQKNEIIRLRNLLEATEKSNGCWLCKLFKN